MQLLDMYKNYFNFSGRTSRSNFWLTLIWYVVAVIVFMGVYFLAGGTSAGWASFNVSTASAAANIIGILYTIFQVLSIIPLIALYFRRAIDMGINRWWGLLGWILSLPIGIIWFGVVGSKDSSKN